MIWRALGVLAARQKNQHSEEIEISNFDSQRRFDSEADVNSSSLFSPLYFHVNVMESESRIIKR